METLLPALTERFIEGAALLKEQQQQEELARQRADEERKRQAELKRLAEEDEKRRLKLAELAADWQTATQIRAFIAAIRDAPFDPNAIIEDRSLAAWLTWAEAAADSLDITGEGAEGLFERIAAVKAERSWK